MSFSAYRDIKQKSEKRFDQKQDKQAQFRAVVVDENGLQSGSGSIWASQNKRRVWIMPIGGVQPFQVVCVRITPVIGLGVIVGYADPLSRTLEVLRTDYEFYLETSGVVTAYESPSNEDFLPGGRMQLWLASKMLQPLAIYPQATGLIVNVVKGYYPYVGVRTFYGGAINVSLVQNPNAGEHYYAGLYLDAANALQVVYGASVVLATTPPEPTWPAGAFQLGVVRINDTQTSIILSQDTNPLNDIFDRRMLWVDIDSFGSGGWPFTHVLTVSSTNPNANHATITLAIAAASAGDVVLFDAETFTENVTVNKNITLMGMDRVKSVIAGEVVISTASAIGENFTVNLAGSGTQAVLLSGSQTRLYDVTANHTGVANARGISVTNSNCRLFGCLVTTSGSTTSRALYVNSSGLQVDAQCEFAAGGIGTLSDIYVDSSGGTNTTLYGPLLSGGTINTFSASQSVRGWYRSSSGDKFTQPTSGENAGVWRYRNGNLRIKELDLPTAIANLASGDEIFLFPGTYTLAVYQTLSINNTSIVSDDASRVTITNAQDTAQTLNVTGDNVTLRNLTITQTGAGGGPTSVVTFDGDNFTIDNCILTKTGAPTLGTGLYQFGGTGAKVFNTNITVSGATTNYGYYNAGVAGGIEFWGGKISGTQADIWSDITNSTLATYGTILVHNLVDYAGVYPRHNIQPLPIKPIMLNSHPLIWQRGTSFAAAANAAYSADRFKYGKSGLMVHTLSQSTDVPTMSQAGVLLQYSLLADCTTIDASIGAGDHSEIMYTIEGYNFQRIAQQQFTFPLWVKATKTGIYCVAFRNSVADRSYVAEITVNTTATWEYKQVAVVASPSAGTWDYATGAGLFVTLAYAVGSTFQTTAGTWQTGNFLGTSNQVNGVDSTSNDTRVIFGDPIPGPYARPFEAQRINDLLDYCQRYYQKSYDLATDPGTNTAVGAESYQTRTAIAASTAGVLRPGKIRFAPRMRTNTPTVTPYANDGTINAVSNVSGATVRTGATITASIGETGFSRVEISNADADAITADQVIAFQWTADDDF